jgi:hypothetical protein
VDTVPYGCWRRELFDRIGHFDPGLVRNQDDEFNLRLIRAGGRIWQNPSILSWYTPRSSLRGVFRQYFQYGYWKVAVIHKHRIPASWRHLVPAVFVVANAAGLSFAVWSYGRGDGIGWMTGLWLTGIALYCAANGAASLLAARRFGWDTLPWLPAAFAAFQVSYGLGFLCALVLRLRPGSSRAPALRIFTRLTR